MVVNVPLGWVAERRVVPSCHIGWSTSHEAAQPSRLGIFPPPPANHYLPTITITDRPATTTSTNSGRPPTRHRRVADPRWTRRSGRRRSGAKMTRSPPLGRRCHLSAGYGGERPTRVGGGTPRGTFLPHIVVNITRGGAVFPPRDVSAAGRFRHLRRATAGSVATDRPPRPPPPPARHRPAAASRSSWSTRVSRSRRSGSIREGMQGVHRRDDVPSSADADLRQGWRDRRVCHPCQRCLPGPVHSSPRAHLHGP